MGKIILKIIIIVCIILLVFWEIRFLNPREIDDVSPEIYCEKDYLKKSEILWIIPKYNNISISENK